jgi:hypothetical protein
MKNRAVFFSKSCFATGVLVMTTKCSPFFTGESQQGNNAGQPMGAPQQGYYTGQPMGASQQGYNAGPPMGAPQQGYNAGQPMGAPQQGYHAGHTTTIGTAIYHKHKIIKRKNGKQR